jgi:hypothetical protein
MQVSNCTIPDESTRSCAKCNKSYPSSEFAVGKTRVRYRGMCRPCWKPFQKVNDARPENILSRSRCKARAFGVKWEITLEQLKAFKAMPCHYCEGPQERTGVGLDRLDPKGDYAADNVVPCCGLCNTTRARTFTPDQMRKIGRVIKEIRAECAATGQPVPIPEPYRVRQEKIAARKKKVSA